MNQKALGREHDFLHTGSRYSFVFAVLPFISTSAISWSYDTREVTVKLYSYIVKHDRGLAPNPFYGYCTLGLCTPNHMGIKADTGDWIVGFAPAKRDNRLIFAMMVYERQHFNDYFHDKRFQRKKPVTIGTWRQRCGDNIYYCENEKWSQIPSPYHYSQQDLRKDTKHPYVFISKSFYYFGDAAPEIPECFREIIWNRQGCKYGHASDIVNGFIVWLEDNFQKGKIGEPMDREVDDIQSSCSVC